ncbi:tub-1 [Symbiodinium sp. CCMP2456]|nr:tub-1 [Symbiodinium sp. CCMP2456]
MALHGLLRQTTKEEHPRPYSSLSIARAPTRATEHQPSSAWSSRPNTARGDVSRQSNREGYNLESQPVARPLRLENASADLIKDLERLSGRRPRCQLAEELVHKANDKLNEFMGFHIYLAEDRQTIGTDLESEPLKQLNAKFVELVSDIEAALAGTEEATLPPLTVRPNGTVLEESLEEGKKLFVVIPLPCRRVEVLVNLTRISGDVHLYGSDIDPRPSASSELEEEGGELCYRHDPDIGGNRSSGIVRTALYLCIQADEQQKASFRLRVFQKRLMENGNQWGVASLQTACKRVEQKLAVIRSDQAHRTKFEERLKEAKEHLRQKSGASSRDFCRLNHLRARTWGTDRARSTGIQRQRLLKRQAAEFRREQLDSKREERMQWWLDRPELRRLEKEREMQRRHEALQMEERRAEWMTKLAMASFVIVLFKVKTLQSHVKRGKRSSGHGRNLKHFVRQSSDRVQAGPLTVTDHSVPEEPDEKPDHPDPSARLATDSEIIIDDLQSWTPSA